MGMRDKIAAIVGSTGTADRVLQLFNPIHSYETPALDDPVLQPEAPGVMYSYRTVRWESPTEPAPNEPVPVQTPDQTTPDQTTPDQTPPDDQPTDQPDDPDADPGGGQNDPTA